MRVFNYMLLFLLWNLFVFALAACSQEQTVEIKLMSYNIRHGVGLDTIPDLSRSAEIIKSISPDICVLQEVDNFCLRSESVGQTEYLAQYTSLKGTFGKFMNFQGGEYGMATLVGKPLIATHLVQLPDGKDEPRASIVQEIEIEEDCIVALANVHFDWISGSEGSENRSGQAKALLKFLDSLNRTTIIMGDFNCDPDSPTMEFFNSEGFIFVEKRGDKLSFQGDNPVEIDHLIYRNVGKVNIKEKDAFLLHEPITSDHRPLIAELEITF